jgi:hypothetical protein
MQHESWHQNFVPGFDHELAHCVKVYCVMQEILLIQFFVNKQLARFEVDKSLGRKLILFLAQATAAAEPHSGIELAEPFSLLVLLWVQALFSNHSSQNYMPHHPIMIVATVKHNY